VSEWDAAGWRPSKDELDRFGRAIPDDEYQTKDFERVVALRARTEAMARHLAEFMRKNDRFAKTIVFCVDQEHATEMATALGNLNGDLRVTYPDYVCRVTADEGDIGRGHLGRFQDVETKSPVILTTQLLTTGVDAPTCKNVVLARVVSSMSEFKQIIGRGTRVRDEYGKLWFNIIDYTGSATRLFADPTFDGEPVRIIEQEIDDEGEVTSETTERDESEPPEETGPDIFEPPSEVSRCLVPRECLGDLARDPLRGRTCRYAKRYPKPTAVPYDNETIENLESDCWQDKKVDRCDAVGMVAEKRPPVLRRWPPAAAHIPSNRRLSDIEAKLE
jgi:type I restriction enzyme, R subunit